ncbi:multidrug effflux MFS transporter [Myroides albus]|uniref:multidrug effflux MFS transporter n=1 Tax=Myroides albus TaxID=2562892 RepID=UPI002159425C|nr:multidrug effflux MFS transporter [Myroides albus]UVD79284.1 multidrug effflux MFS transporter [Myroides albus]
MKKLTKTQFVVVIILSLLSALEPFSIDLYLPGFLKISQTFNTDLKSVQLSISFFLGGFAIGQLFWGIISDKYGRKIPTIISLLVFILATVGCIYAQTIEQFWIARFFQAFAGCAGVVIARAVVNEFYDTDQSMHVFSLLAIIAGIAPIIGPVMGNFLINHFVWQSAFVTLFILGVVCLISVILFLPETRIVSTTSSKTNMVQDFKEIVQNNTFIKYTLIGSLTYSILMIYLANAPYLIMEYGGLSSNMFSSIFAFNAIGLILGAWLANSVLSRWYTVEQIVKLTVYFGIVASVVFLIMCSYKSTIELMLIPLFFIVLTLGVLFPTTTKLALAPFTTNSGSASALLGTLQLTLTFIISALTNIIPLDLITLTGGSLLLCHLLYLFCYLFKDKKVG